MENKQLQQAKEIIAKKYGYLNFEAIPYNHISSVNVRYENYQDIVNEVAIEYHRLMSEWVSVDDETPPINIELLVESPTGINHLSRWRPAYNIFTCQSKGESTLDWKWKRI